MMAIVERAWRVWRPGTILTELVRLVPADENGVRAQRKVYLVVGPSRTPGKVRLRTWSHSARDWSNAKAWHLDLLAPAPKDWPQTRAAKRWRSGRLP